MHNDSSEPSEGAAQLVLRVCPVAECGEPSYHSKAGYCNRHRQRFRKHGDPIGGGPDRDLCKWISFDSSGRPSCVHGPAIRGGWRGDKPKWTCSKKHAATLARFREKNPNWRREMREGWRKNNGWYDEGGMATKPTQFKEITNE